MTDPGANPSRHLASLARLVGLCRGPTSGGVTNKVLSREGSKMAMWTKRPKAMAGVSRCGDSRWARQWAGPLAATFNSVDRSPGPTVYWASVKPSISRPWGHNSATMPLGDIAKPFVTIQGCGPTPLFRPRQVVCGTFTTIPQFRPTCPVTVPNRPGSATPWRRASTPGRCAPGIAPGFAR